MDYDTRQILPDEYRNREERPKRRRVFISASCRVISLTNDGNEMTRNLAERIDGFANGEERNHQWRDDLQTAPRSTVKR